MKQLVFTILALLNILSLSSCQNAAVHPEEASKTVLHLPMTRVSRESLSEQIALPAIVFALPDRSVKVSPGTAGKLVDVNVVPGQQVRRGQVIACLDNRQLTNQANSAHAKVLVAQAGMQQAETNLLLAKNTEERNTRLVQQEVGAVKDLVVAKSQVETARDQLAAAKAQVVDAQAVFQDAQAQLTYTVVRSPITGLVAQRFLNISDSADPATPIVQIVDLSDVVVEASLPTSQPAKIIPGQAAIITAVCLPGHQLKGEVQSISPVTDNQGTTVGIRILCANPGCLLKEGMPVVATIVIATHPAAVTVPVTALVDDPGDPQKKMVYVYKNGEITRVEVKAGIEKDARVEIISGLTPGEEIVAAGAYGIPDGTVVEAQNGSLYANSKVPSKSD